MVMNQSRRMFVVVAVVLTSVVAAAVGQDQQPAGTILATGGGWWDGNETFAEDSTNTDRNCTASKPTTEEGFLNGFAESISVILVSEIGDKTFFIAAILAMQNNKLVVFLSAISALFVMTILSGLLGWVATQFIPREYTYWTCTAIMFLFGVKMLWEAWRMDPDEAEETRKEVELELGTVGAPPTAPEPNTKDSGEVLPPPPATAAEESSSKSCSSKCGQVWRCLTSPLVAAYNWLVDTALVRAIIRLDRAAQHGVDRIEESIQQCYRSLPCLTCRRRKQSNHESQGEGEANTEISGNTEGQQTTTTGGDSQNRPAPDKSWFGKKCLQIFKLFVKGFTMTFIAEWGDRSQLATIVLVGLYDVGGVIVGGCLGHFICTGVAVLCGALIARFISVRMVTFLGALVFLGFAIASIFTFEEDITPEDVLCYLYNDTSNGTLFTYRSYIYDTYAHQLLE